MIDKKKVVKNNNNDFAKNQSKDCQFEINNIDDVKKAIVNNISTSIKDKAINHLNEIINKLPNPISSLVEDCFNYKRIPKEYTLNSILFAFSNASGLAFKIESLNYTNYANLYFVLVGSRGDAKSEAIKIATHPFNIMDDANYEEYERKRKDFNSSYPNGDNEKEPSRKQFFLQNATIESALFSHLHNPYSIGLCIDELKHLIDKMANSNSSEGSGWRIFLLQGNTNDIVDVSRKTSLSYRIKKSYPTLLGSIQTQFIPAVFGSGNLESGLVDRILFTNKLTQNTTLTNKKMPDSTLQNYGVLLNNLLQQRITIENTKKHLTVPLTKEADNMIFKYSQDLIIKQSKTMDITKHYMSKMLINIHKLVLLVHLIYNSTLLKFTSKIELRSVELAILLNDFYLMNFEMLLKPESKEIPKSVVHNEIINLAKKNKVKQSTVVALTGLSKGQVSKLFNKK